MKKWLCICVLCIQLCFSQKEANIWYFGNQAGLDFNSSVPVPLSNSAMSTVVGTASVADSNGNLLFYSDGNTVWNKNHEIMQNGTGLLATLWFEFGAGEQFVMAIPKPDNQNIYYVFTSDYYFGLNYSEIDMTLDNGLGAITSIKNVYLAPADQSITATLHANGKDVWLVTHGWLIDDRLYVFSITSSGVKTTPVVNYFNNTGPIKFSPDGKKMVVFTSLSTITLYDFDNTTGILSNPVNIKTQINVNAVYGIEFSPSGNALYFSFEHKVGGSWHHDLWQFNLNASNIDNSKVVIYSSSNNAGTIRGLQLGPDYKIYCGGSPSPGYISVINSPNNIGSTCNFNIEGVYLKNDYLSLQFPQFIQSYFYVGIQTENVCLGESTQFHFNSSKTYDSLLWDFGDGNTSIDKESIHTYANSGDYTVTLTVTSGTQTTSDSKTITIYETPIAYKPDDLVFCDEYPEFFWYDLTVQTPFILNGQDPDLFEVLYYFNMDDYNNNRSRTTGSGTGYNEEYVASVRNRNNPECNAITTFGVQFPESPKLNEMITDLSLCDNTSIGTDNDGLLQIDLTQIENKILNGQLASDFEFSYFKDIAMQNQITNPTNYQNNNSLGTIYVRVSNKDNAFCSKETSFNLEVHPLPAIASSVDLKQCDNDLDGFSAFNLNEALAEISFNFMNETITFYKTESDAISGSSAIPNPTTYTNGTVSFDKVWARVENAYGCFRTSLINLTVTTTQIPSNFIREFQACEDLDGDDTNGVSIFNFSSVQAEIEGLFPSGQDLVITYYRNEADALAEQNKIDDISNYSNTGYPYVQQIYVRVDSKVDNDCIGLGAHINLNVVPMPEFTIESPQIVCSSDPTFTVILDPIESNIHQVYGYEWVFEDGTVLSHEPTLPVSNPGTYSITLTRTDGSSCSRTKEVFVNSSELATITSDAITVVDASKNNTVTVNANNLGQGDYEFALNDEFSSYQDEPIFENVSSGINTLYVRDKKGCGTSSIDISIIGFPKFFTPNGDGNNDTWQINGVNGQFQTGSDIYIYDRYGKLLKQLTTTSNGWDGTFNGTLLSSDDYWFSVHLQDGRIFKGHFTLKR